MESFVLWSVKVWPARGLNNFISAASILRLCETVKVQFSDPYKNVGKTKVLYKLHFNLDISAVSVEKPSSYHSNIII
jgi:hypothetical protein